MTDIQIEIIGRKSQAYEGPEFSLIYDSDIPQLETGDTAALDDVTVKVYERILVL